MIDIIQAIKTGKSIYKVLDFFLSDVYDEIGKVYTDLADAHFLSAKQAYKAYQNSNNPKSEIRSIINHLRDSHNIYHTLVRRTKTSTFLLFWSGTTKPDCNNKTTALATNIATIISLLYAEMKEFENARDWKKTAIADFEYHESNYQFIYEELVKVNSSFGYTKRERAPFHSTGTDFNYVSEEGKRYALNKIRQQKADLTSLLNF